MAFCTNCGANIGEAQSCARCGAVAGAAVPPPAAGPAPPPAGVPAKSGTSALRIILIVFGILVALGVLSLAGVMYVGYRIARSARVTTDGKNARIETPIGTIETTKGSSEEADRRCAAGYPNARASEHGETVRVGRLTSLVCETNDSLETVSDYFRKKFPDARVSVKEERRHTIAGATDHGAFSIVIEPRGGRTQITMAGWGFTED